jgi:two-component system response regulator (stage 0 sporulation protein F)
MANRKLLCVDDDSGIRKFYKNIFGSYGYDVIVAAGGAEALELFLSRKVDGVVTDLEMPGMTGTELAKKLKKLRPELPVVLVSGAKSAEIPQKIVDASIAKGTPIAGLVAQMDALMKSKQRRRVPLRPTRLIPLGSVLASIALVVYALPRIWK